MKTTTYVTLEKRNHYLILDATCVADGSAQTTVNKVFAWIDGLRSCAMSCLKKRFTVLVEIHGGEAGGGLERL